MFHSVFPSNLFFFILKCFVFQDIFLRKGKIQKKLKYKKRERERKKNTCIVLYMYFLFDI